MELDPKDIRIDTFHAKRVGGWSTAQPVAVRITHIPTGISVEKCDDRSVHRNKANAYADLCGAVEKYYKSVNHSFVDFGLTEKLNYRSEGQSAKNRHARKVIVSGIKSI